MLSISGPPLALGWDDNEEDEVVIDIDDYERSFVDNNDDVPSITIIIIMVVRMMGRRYR